MIQKTIDLLKSGWMVILAVVIAGNAVYFSGDQSYYGSYYTGTQKFRSNSQLYGRLTDVLNRFSSSSDPSDARSKVSFHSYHIEGQYFFDVVIESPDSAVVWSRLNALREAAVNDSSIRNFNIEAITQLKVFSDSLNKILENPLDSEGPLKGIESQLHLMLSLQAWNVKRTLYVLGQDFEVFPLDSSSVIASNRSFMNAVVKINLICLIFGMLAAIAYKEIKRR